MAAQNDNSLNNLLEGYTNSLITMNAAEPTINPMNANQDIFFKYQKKSIFSIPIATTPAAEPMINMDPPVPAEKAIKCHNGLSIDSENIPKLAATNGTLSITAEPTPNKSTTKSDTRVPSNSVPTSGIPCFKLSAKLNKIPKDSNAATAIKIPKKNKIIGI